MSSSEPVAKVQLHLDPDDLIDYQRGRRTLRVRDIMETEIIAVPPTLSLEKLAELFLEAKVSGFPVIDSRGELLGLVSQKDLFDAVFSQHTAVPSEQDGNIAEFYQSSYTDFSSQFGVLPGGRVQDVMTPFIYFATPDTPVKEAIELMLTHSIHRVVITEQKRLRGMISTSQLLAVLANLL